MAGHIYKQFPPIPPFSFLHITRPSRSILRIKLRFDNGYRSSALDNGGNVPLAGFGMAIPSSGNTMLPATGQKHLPCLCRATYPGRVWCGDTIQRDKFSQAALLFCGCHAHSPGVVRRYHLAVNPCVSPGSFGVGRHLVEGHSDDVSGGETGTHRARLHCNIASRSRQGSRSRPSCRRSVCARSGGGMPAPVSTFLFCMSIRGMKSHWARADTTYTPHTP